jgi:hypothetical protein
VLTHVTRQAGSWLIFNVGQNMKRFTAIVLAGVLLVAGCADNSPPVSLVKKEELRQILDAKFVLTSVPKEREEELYRVLEVFAEGRRPDELVRSVEFSSSSEASLSFSDRGMHGGGGATLKKKSGKWTIAQKYYFM